MTPQFVQVAKFDFPSDPGFVLFLNELEHAGIEYVCPEKVQLENQPFLSIGLGGLRVLVDAKDVTAAKAILDGMYPDELGEPDEADLEISKLKADEEKSMQKSAFIIKAVGIFLALMILVRMVQCVVQSGE